MIKRYLYFASSLRQFGLSGKSLCEEKTDDSGAEGALAKVLEVLKQIHEKFYDKVLCLSSYLICVKLGCIDWQLIYIL